MSLLRIDPNPSPRQLAVFGVTWLVFFAAAALVVAGRGGPAAVVTGLGIAAVAAPAIGRLAPGVLRIVYLGMAYATFPLGCAVSFLLLAAIYYVVLTPTGLFMRWLGHDPLDRRFDADAESYWKPRKAEESPHGYFRQF